MPELPEVETVVRDLRAASLKGHSIRRIAVYWPGIIAGMSEGAFQRALRGRRIADISRRAKYILFHLDSKKLLAVHLRMSGGLRLCPRTAIRDRHEHICMLLDDGRELRYHDTRKFGRWRMIRKDEEPLLSLGPEPLNPSFTGLQFRQRIRLQHRCLKALLLDQKFIAGMGNIYTDEALFAAQLHPLRKACTLSNPEIAKLFRSIRHVLRQGIRNRGTSLGFGDSNFAGSNQIHGHNRKFLNVYQRTHQPCLRCGATIQRIIVAQRSTHLCPHCQGTGTQD